jgi:hypothetical protein
MRQSMPYTSQRRWVLAITRVHGADRSLACARRYLAAILALLWRHCVHTDPSAAASLGRRNVQERRRGVQ